MPLEHEPLNRKKTSVATEATEKAFIAQRTSIERSSPPSFKNEVNIVTTDNLQKCLKIDKSYVSKKFLKYTTNIL